MLVISRFFRQALILVILLLVSSQAQADKKSRLLTRLDQLNKEIAAAHEVPVKMDLTIEELRKGLYESAISTRDTKKLSDDIELAIASGNPSGVELAKLRTDIVKAGIVLRDLRDQMDELEKISKLSREMLEDYAAQIESLQKDMIDPDAVIQAAGADVVKGLNAQIKDLKSQLADRDQSMEKLLRDYNSLAASPKKQTPVKTDIRMTDPSLVKAFDLLAAGKVDEAYESFKSAVAMNPNANDARIGLAACQFERGEFEDAQRLVDSVLGEDDRNSRAMGLRGAILYRQGKPREAKKMLEKAIRADNKNAYNYNYLGVVLSSMGKTKDAIEEMEHSVALDPNYTSALYNLALLLATDEKPDLVRAKTYYNKALALGCPRNPTMDELLKLK